MSSPIADRLADTGRLIWVFDGECVLCLAGVRFAARRDPHARIGYLAMRSPLGRQAAAQAGVDADAPATFLVYDRGEAFAKSDAVIRIGERLGGGWSVLAKAARLVPRPLRDAVYGVVARNRYRWFGRNELCQLEDLGLSDRLID